MYLIGVDVGTTHCKAGLFHRDGKAEHIAIRETPTIWDPNGPETYDPERLWCAVSETIQEVSARISVPPDAIGIASQAETGVLLDRVTLQPRFPFLPWFDQSSAPQAEILAKEDEPVTRFRKSGLRANRKVGLSKILWLKERDAALVRDATWLSVSDYIGFRLTGVMGTDYSLAGRTFTFRMDTLEWDADWIRHFGLNPGMFPPAQPSGTVLGTAMGEGAARAGVPSGTRVCIAGHDHVLAALAVGVAKPGPVLNSMGTAETLVGALAERELNQKDYESNLNYGRHVAPNTLFWMGGPPSSGASVEWMRSRLGDPPLTYQDIARLNDEAGPKPTGILYYPYLSGSGAPWPEPRMRAAFVGLDDEHTRAHLVKAVLEGTAYELEAVRRAAEAATGVDTEAMQVVGGGTRNPGWLQIKANVSGCRLDIPEVPEAACLGAAMAAGIGCGFYADCDDAIQCVSAGRESSRFEPDDECHSAYRRIFECGYQPLHENLRAAAIALKELAPQ